MEETSMRRSSTGGDTRDGRGEDPIPLSSFAEGSRTRRQQKAGGIGKMRREGRQRYVASLQTVRECEDEEDHGDESRRPVRISGAGAGAGEVRFPCSSVTNTCAESAEISTRQQQDRGAGGIVMRMRRGQRDDADSMQAARERKDEDYEDEERKDDIATAREVAEDRARQRAIQSALEKEMVAESKEEMKEVLRVMGPLPGRISELLSAEAAAGGSGTGRGLAFMEKELSTIVAALRQISASTAVWPEAVDARVKARLTHLRDLADWTRDHLLVSGCAPRQAGLPELNLAWIEQLLLVDAAHHDGCSSVAVSPDDDPRFPQPQGGGGTPVGIDGPTKKLFRWSVTPPAAAAEGEEADMSRRIIAIVGPTGVGKTTLAMELHRQATTVTAGGKGKYFQCHAATKMSRRPPAARKILKHIMSQIIDSAAQQASSSHHELLYGAAMLDGDEHELAYDINKYLQDKRYLIVIDDLWRTEDWKIMQDAFPSNKHGSRIIITTPIRSVPHSCCSFEDDFVLHEVKPLGKLDSERLFSMQAFGTGGSCSSDHLRQVSDEILRRCDGIPLFITAMAGLIKQAEQEEVNNSSAAYWLERIPELKQVEEALSPSYDDLPYELKLLSLHMSTFPLGYEIGKHRLIRKWVAEGLIAQNMWRTYEEVAEEYFWELLDRGIIHPVTRRYNFSEAETCCYQVNHFMIQFLASVSAQQNFRTSWTLKPTPAGDSTKARMVHRLSLHQPDPELGALLERTGFSHIRSLTVSDAVNGIPLCKFVHLVVLDLEGWENLDDNDMVKICSSQFFLLKYLSIRYTRVSWLPSQISELGCLETLDISHTQIRELPSHVWELPELQALDLRNTQVRSLPRYLPKCLRRLLVNNDDGKMHETVTVVPEDIEHWKLLETLETIDLSNSSASFIESLFRLRFLEVLAVKWCFHQCYDEKCIKALQSVIHRSGCLRSLTIHCELGCSMEFLGTLPDAAPPSLRIVRIMGRFLSAPKWIQGLPYLVFLEITVCKLAPGDLELLGTLQRLETLVLGLDFLPEDGAVAIGSGAGFAQLQRFSVDCRLPRLEFKEGAMPKLTNLDLTFSMGPSPASQEIGPSGIANLLSLEQVTLCYYQWYINSDSVKAVINTVRQQIAELGYLVKLVNNGIEEDVEMILTKTSGGVSNKSLTTSNNPAKNCNDLILRFGSLSFDVTNVNKEEKANIASSIALPCNVFTGANLLKKAKSKTEIKIGSHTIYI